MQTYRHTTNIQAHSKHAYLYVCLFITNHADWQLGSFTSSTSDVRSNKLLRVQRALHKISFNRKFTLYTGRPTFPRAADTLSVKRFLASKCYAKGLLGVVFGLLRGPFCAEFSLNRVKGSDAKASEKKS